VAARSKAWVPGVSLVGTAGSNTAAGEYVLPISCECCVLSSRGLCNGQIPHPEDSYRECIFTIECDEVQKLTSTPAMNS
jgi:hypothetical protein